jgi:predicted oxidoreductase
MPMAEQLRCGRSIQPPVAALQKGCAPHMSFALRKEHEPVAVPRITIAAGGPGFSRLAQGFGSIWRETPSARDLHGYLMACLDEGITTLDNSAVYGGGLAETLLGEALARGPSLRERLQLVTKCDIVGQTETTVHHYDTGKEHIVFSAKQSLRRLQTDRIDVLLLHRWDPLMDADEVAEAFTELKASGKVLHFGVSNHAPSQFELLASRLSFPLVTNEVEFSVINMEASFNGTLDQCQRLRISPMAWGPMGGGKLFTSDAEQAVRVRGALREVGDMLGEASIDQVALAWILRHPAKIVPILGTGNLSHMKSAVKAGNLELNRDQWFRIWTASQGHDVP